MNVNVSFFIILILLAAYQFILSQGDFNLIMRLNLPPFVGEDKHFYLFSNLYYNCIKK
ncbi:hypothetical protein RCH33_249 [Flavobacterium daejeonense]|nr:hypothetical protein RCH33_249 [Flavobacterium daejeonense]